MTFTKTFSMIQAVILIIFLVHCITLEAKPQWNSNDPFGFGSSGSISVGVPGGEISNTDPFDTPFFKNHANKPYQWGQNGNTLDRFNNVNSKYGDFETNRNIFSKIPFDFDRTNNVHTQEDTTLSMFWIITIVTFIIFAITAVACICIPTCYLAKYRGVRTAGRIYQPAPGNVTMGGYPTQVVTVQQPPPSYTAGPPLNPGQYPYPNSNQLPSQNYPAYPYPPVGPAGSGEFPQAGFIPN